MIPAINPTHPTARAASFCRRWQFRAPEMVEKFKGELHRVVAYLGWPARWRHRLRVMGQRLGQELQGDKAADLSVLGIIGHAHAAAVQLLLDVVVENRPAGDRRTGWS